MKLDKNTILTKNFTWSEFTCNCGKEHEHKISGNLVEMLQELRDSIGCAIHVNSAYRCKEHNETVGGKPNSQHVEGTAADIEVPQMTLVTVALHAAKIGFIGIGLYDTFLHLDVRENKELTVWDHRAK